MFRNVLPKIDISVWLCAMALTAVVSDAAAQAKPSGEVIVSQCWLYQFDRNPALTMAADGARIYVGLEDGEVEALSLDGKKQWATELGGDINSNILVTDGAIFIMTASAGEAGKSGSSVLRSLSKETGITIRTVKLPGSGEYYLSGYNGSLIVISKAGVIQALDPNDGAVKWKRELAEGFSAEPAFFGDKLFMASRSTGTFSVALATGEVGPAQKVPFAATAVGQASSGGLIVGDERGNIAAYSSGSDKPDWKYRSGGEVSAIFPVNGYLLFTSHDNFAYRISTGNGSVTWKRRLSGRVSYVSVIDEHFALVAASDDHGAVIIDLKNGKTAGQITLDADESIVDAPVFSNGTIFVLGNRAVRAYNLNGCDGKKEGGRPNNESGKTAIQKTKSSESFLM